MLSPLFDPSSDGVYVPLPYATPDDYDNDHRNDAHLGPPVIVV